MKEEVRFYSTIIIILALTGIFFYCLYEFFSMAELFHNKINTGQIIVQVFNLNGWYFSQNQPKDSSWILPVFQNKLLINGNHQFSIIPFQNKGISPKHNLYLGKRPDSCLLGLLSDCLHVLLLISEFAILQISLRIYNPFFHN